MDHPEELAAAQVLVKLHLGSQRRWRLRAQAVRDRQLAGLVDCRRKAGSTRAILALRLGLMAALIARRAYIVFTDPDGYIKLLVTGVRCFVAVLGGGHVLTVLARIPVMPPIRGPWLNELPAKTRSTRRWWQSCRIKGVALTRTPFWPAAAAGSASRTQPMPWLPFTTESRPCDWQRRKFDDTIRHFRHAGTFRP